MRHGQKNTDKYYLEITDKCHELKFDFERVRDYSKLIVNLKGIKINKQTYNFL